jgi:CheY-like chemotaxis protein
VTRDAIASDEVLVAEDLEEALRVCTGYNEPIDLLLTDMVMPGGTGEELATEILASRPKTRVLYMSGYSESYQRGRSGLDSAFLAKPFSPGELTRKVREVLEST